jgi:DNA-binding MarR family transcriptional regulator
MKARTTGPGPRYDALLQVMRTAESLWEASRRFFARWELSPSQFNILSLSHEEPGGHTQIDLSRRLIMHRSNVTGLIDRLERRGLVRRARAAGDRRVHRILLTASGRRVMEEILPEYHAAAEVIWGSIPAARVRALVSDLQELSRNATGATDGKDSDSKRKRLKGGRR